jgi:hypothetical protein
MSEAMVSGATLVGTSENNTSLRPQKISISSSPFDSVLSRLSSRIALLDLSAGYDGSREVAFEPIARFVEQYPSMFTVG